MEQAPGFKILVRAREARAPDRLLTVCEALRGAILLPKFSVLSLRMAILLLMIFGLAVLSLLAKVYCDARPKVESCHETVWWLSLMLCHPGIPDSRLPCGHSVEASVLYGSLRSRVLSGSAYRNLSREREDASTAAAEDGFSF